MFLIVFSGYLWRISQHFNTKYIKYILIEGIEQPIWKKVLRNYYFFRCFGGNIPTKRTIILDVHSIVELHIVNWACIFPVYIAIRVLSDNEMYIGVSLRLTSADGWIYKA